MILLFCAGIQHFAPDLDDDRPSSMISFMAMELLGPSIWDAANHMRMHQQVIEDSEAWSDDELDSQPAHESLCEPSTAWIVQTGKGMLQVRSACAAIKPAAKLLLHVLTCLVHIACAYAHSLPAQVPSTMRPAACSTTT